MLFKNSNPAYKIYQADDFADIKPLGYEKTAVGYRIQKPAMKYVVFAEPYSDSWALPGSTKLQFPVNAWEYVGGNEIKRENTILPGYIISFLTLFILAAMLIRNRL